MSRAIDEKIVKMSMDNKDFQSKATQTVGIFGKLMGAFAKAKPLNLDKSVKSIDDVNKAADRTTMDKLVGATQTVASKFSALGVIAITALQNITNRAVNAGMAMTKAFTIQPITDGFNEYELKMKSIQTIMSNTMGNSSLQDVTKTLDELNVYADKTIYSFADMTSNIGTFTAAGVGLKDSAVAIKGIANLAAASGSNTQQASTAMYQLSQGIANGKLNLQDWNSVVNAGMGGKLFQNALKESAKAIGQNVDESVSFRDSLQQGWLTTDVLLKTLGEFAENDSMLEAATKVRTFTQLVDTASEALGSGWATTWEIIFGDFEQAGEMWTNANNVISAALDKSADARNKLLQDFVDMGGRASAINIVSNAFNALTGFVGAVKLGMRDVFPAVTAQNLMNIVKAVENFTKGLMLNDIGIRKVRTVARAFFNILDIGITSVKLVAQALVAMIPDGTGGKIVDLIVRMAELINNFAEAFKASEKTSKGFKSIKDVANSVAKTLGALAKGIGAFFGGAGDAVSKIASVLQPIGSAIKNAVKSVTSSMSINDILNGGFIAALILAVKKFSNIGDNINDVIDKIVGLTKDIGGSFKIFDDLSDALKSLTTSVKVDSVVKIAVAVGILAGSLKLLSTIKGEDMAKSLTALAITMLLLNKSLSAISKADMGIKNAITAGIVLPALAVAVLALAVSLKILETIDPAQMAKALVGLVVIVTTLVLAMAALSKIGGKISTSAVAMLALSVAVVILASAVKKLSEIEAKDLQKGIVAIGAILLELAIFLKVVDGAKLNAGSAIGVVLIASALHIIIAAIDKIAAMPVKNLQKGLVTIGIILVEIAAFVKLTSGSKVMSAAVGMNLVAAAINLLVGPLQELGNTPTDVITKGLLTMAGALAAVVLSMKLASGSMGGAASILIVAVAVNALVPPIETLGNLSLEQLAKGLGALAIGLGLIAIAANLIGIGGSVALLAFAVAITAVGLAMGLIALAIAAFTTSLTILATMTASNIANIINALGQLLTGLITLVPLAIELIMTLVLGMAQALANGAPQLAAYAGIMILGVLTAMSVFIPEFVSTGLEFINGVMQAFSEGIGPVVQSAVELIIQVVTGVANAIRDNNEEIVSAVLNVIESIMEIVIEAMVQLVSVIAGWIPGVSDKAKEMGDGAKTALRDAFQVREVGEKGSGEFTVGVQSGKDAAGGAGRQIGDSAKAGAGSVSLVAEGAAAGGQFGTAVGGTSGQAGGAGRTIGTSAKTGAGSISLSGVGSQSGQAFATGVGGKTGSASSSGTRLGNSAKTGAGSVDMSSAGANAGQGFANGIGSKESAVSGAASRLASLAKGALEKVLSIFSPSRELKKDGGFFSEGFALGITDGEDGVVSSASDLGMAALESMRSFSALFNSALLENLDLEPIIRPVLDMSRVKGMAALEDIVIRGTSPDAIGGGVVNNYTYNISLETQSTNPVEIAKEVERIIVRRIQS